MQIPSSPAAGDPVADTRPERRARPRRARLAGPLGEKVLFLALVLPNLALLGVFVYRPLIDNIRLSFFDWNISSPTSTFIGWSNYIEWWNRADSWEVVQNTVIFTVAAVVGSMILGLALALLLDQQLVGRGIVRSAVFAPFVIAGAAIGVAFQFIFDPRFGMISALLTMVGLPVPNFYQDPDWALFMVTVTYIWKNLGYSFVIYLAALQAKPAELYEAAEMDGAGRWATFRSVTLPLLRPTTFFLSITVMLNSLQVFDIIYVMTRGGPQGNGTTTMVFQVYQETFQNFRAGYGATVATIMFLVLLVITAIQVRVMDRRTT
ncbi:carbohydrate ABC transporter membrane protein 1 (CUT1 family) [Dietzia cinnamea]|uniref:Carbohydrate ABC transporter membrane protein 1 (CUT1 family) n=1 Tax=Dietzia cinnamea TaxID=321318 RepID=A0A4R3ZMD9_9ACTN|nr:putative ABC transporter permease protein [Dietzia cinnamea P4]TCW18879.1 carbohydrate ABC transporter membrane protein 1 (CUT1 family) [Dietzia cinnamea]